MQKRWYFLHCIEPKGREVLPIHRIVDTLGLRSRRTRVCHHEARSGRSTETRLLSCCWCALWRLLTLCRDARRLDDRPDRSHICICSARLLNPPLSPLLLWPTRPEPEGGACRRGQRPCPSCKHPCGTSSVQRGRAYRATPSARRSRRACWVNKMVQGRWRRPLSTLTRQPRRPTAEHHARRLQQHHHMFAHRPQRHL